MITESYRAPTTDIKLGDFVFTLNGTQQSREFFVRCIQPDDSEETTSLDMDAYNAQLTDFFSQLMAEGCTEIKYSEIIPNPFT